MRCTYNQSFYAEEKHVTGIFFRPISTATNIYFAHQAAQSLREMLLSAKAPKLYVSIQNVEEVSAEKH